MGDSQATKYEFTRENFKDGVIPTRLLLVCLGGGGSGSSSTSTTPGAGGGSSGYAVGVLALKDGQSYKFSVGGGGKSGNGGNGENTTISEEASLENPNPSTHLIVYGGQKGPEGEDTRGGAGGEMCKNSNSFYTISISTGNAGGKPDGDSEAQKGSDSNIDSIYIMSRADLNREIIVGPHSGGGIEGTKDYRGGGGGASLLGNGGRGDGSGDLLDSSKGEGKPGEGYGSGGGGGALIFMGLSTCKGGSGADGIIRVYY